MMIDDDASKADVGKSCVTKLKNFLGITDVTKFYLCSYSTFYLIQNLVKGIHYYKIKPNKVNPKSKYFSKLSYHFIH